MTPNEIQKALKKRNITQKQIAEKLGVSAMAVSRSIKCFPLGVGISDRIMTAVAAELGQPKEAVFAAYYRGPRYRRTSKAMGPRRYGPPASPKKADL